VQTADGRQQYINVGKYVQAFFSGRITLINALDSVLISDGGSCHFGVVYPGCCKLQVSETRTGRTYMEGLQADVDMLLDYLVVKHVRRSRRP
jgi:hypothetical protein